MTRFLLWAGLLVMALSLFYLKHGSSEMPPAAAIPKKMTWKELDVLDQRLLDQGINLDYDLDLAEALEAQVVRYATDEDFVAWERAVGHNPSRKLGRAALRDIIVVKGFKPWVVLQPFEFPEGLYTQNAFFFILSGVPMPSGNPGRATIYDFNTGTCKGPGCDDDNATPIPFRGHPGPYQKAIEEGLIREAREEDAQAWMTQVKKSWFVSNKGKGLFALGLPRKSWGYVVLKPYTLPQYAVSEGGVFFVPKGVPLPEGVTKYHMVLDFNKMACLGITCDGEAPLIKTPMLAPITQE